MTRTPPQRGDFIPRVYLDIDRAIAYTGGDTATRDLLQMVEPRLSNDVNAIWHHLEAGDAVAAGRALHALKGFAPVFCVNTLIETIGRLEVMGKAAALGPLKLAFAEVGPQLLALQSEIQTYLADLPCSP